MRDTILSLLEKSGELPSLPHIVLRLQKMVQDPDTNARDIAKVIETDPFLVGRIINLSNSAYYSRSTTPIKTLPVAITKIGFKMILKIVYSLKMTKLFTDITILDSTQFWQHSLGTAILTQLLSHRIRSSQEEEDIAYLAGLMHDVGIIVFDSLIPDKYADFLDRITDGEEPLDIQEKKMFGIDHAELGSLFIDKYWQIDESISIAVKQHHNPFRGKKKEHHCEQLVHVANEVCNSENMTNGIQCFHDVLKEDTWDEFGLVYGDIDDILLDASASFDQALELVSMI